MTTSRREILKAIPAAAVVAAAGAVPAGAIPPFTRTGKPRLRLGLAGYSLRDHLTGKLQPAMDLHGFIEKAARWDVDAVELTSYYFPKDFESPAGFDSAYVAGLKRHCHLLGLDVSTTPIRNTFTYPAGPERDREIAHVKRWLDVAAELGSPAIRIFAGDAQKGQDPADGRRHCVQAIEACLDHAARRGVFLALENHGGVVAEPDGLLEIVKAVNEKEGVTFLLAEQNTNVALRFAHRGYILESGRVVMEGEAKDLRENPDVKEFYLGMSDEGRKSFRDVRSYRRRKRWLS